MNNAMTSTTGSSASLSEKADKTLPLGSRSHLKTIRDLFEQIAQQPDSTEVKAMANDGKRMTATLLSWYQEQTSAKPIGA